MKQLIPLLTITATLWLAWITPARADAPDDRAESDTAPGEAFVYKESGGQPQRPRVWGQILSFDISRVVPRQSILAPL